MDNLKHRHTSIYLRSHLYLSGLPEPRILTASRKLVAAKLRQRLRDTAVRPRDAASPPCRLRGNWAALCAGAACSGELAVVIGAVR
jgi:hypothetical protein